MIYTTSDLINKYGSRFKALLRVKKEEYFKISHGLYCDNNPLLSEMENIFSQYPNAVLTNQSAFAFYSMSDYIPDKYYVATSQKAHKINNDKVDQIYITCDILNIGKITIDTQYGKINIYDKERMLIELIRLKSKLPYSYYKEVIKSYRELAKNDQLDLNKIVEYCSHFKNGSNLKKKIQEIIL